MPVGNNRVIGQTKIKLTTLSVSNMVCPHFAECYLSPVQSCKEPSPHLGHSPTLSSGHCPYISGVAYTVDLFSPMHIVSFSLDRPICFNLVLLQVRDEVLQYVDVDVYMNYRSNVRVDHVYLCCLHLLRVRHRTTLSLSCLCLPDRSIYAANHERGYTRRTLTCSPIYTIN